VTYPGYNDRTAPKGETGDQLIQRVIGRLKQRYGLPDTHAFYLVEEADQQARLTDCCGNYFRWPVAADTNGRRDGKLGAWEMDTNGRPKVNMAKARVIHMDRIRQDRNTELAKLDVPFMQALEAADTAEQQRIASLKQEMRDIPQTFDLSRFLTATTLKAAWPTVLPPRNGGQ
jgi:hypothetical protein